MNEDEKDLNEKIEEITTTTFTIAGIPIKEFKRFREFCKHNARVTKIFYDSVTDSKNIKEELCYAIGISRLLDIANAGGAVEMIYQRILDLEQKVIGDVKVSKSSSPKTMGRGGKNE